MARFKIHDVEYDSVSSDEIFEGVRTIPEIEILGFNRGSKQFAFLDENNVRRRNRYVGPIMLEEAMFPRYNWNPFNGFVMDVRRKRISFTKKVAEKLRLSEREKLREIDDLVEFLEGELEFTPLNKLTESNLRRKVKTHPWYSSPFLQYVRFAGEVKSEIDLVTDELKPSYFSRLQHNGHIVYPTTVFFRS